MKNVRGSRWFLILQKINWPNKNKQTKKNKFWWLHNQWEYFSPVNQFVLSCKIKIFLCVYFIVQTQEDGEKKPEQQTSVSSRPHTPDLDSVPLTCTHTLTPPGPLYICCSTDSCKVDQWQSTCIKPNDNHMYVFYLCTCCSLWNLDSQNKMTLKHNYSSF